MMIFDILKITRIGSMFIVGLLIVIRFLLSSPTSFICICDIINIKYWIIIFGRLSIIYMCIYMRKYEIIIWVRLREHK